MTSVFETTPEICFGPGRSSYLEEMITSLEMMSDHPPQMQDDSINTIQETPNSQFRLVLLVTPCIRKVPFMCSNI